MGNKMLPMATFYLLFQEIAGEITCVLHKVWNLITH